MVRSVIALLSFEAAFVLALASLIGVHTFFGDVPLEPLLGAGGVLVLLCFFFGAAALGAGVSLSLQGINAKALAKLAAADLAILLIAIEVYISIFPVTFLPEALNLVAMFVVNVLLVVAFLRLALRASNSGTREEHNSRAASV